MKARELVETRKGGGSVKESLHLGQMEHEYSILPYRQPERNTIRVVEDKLGRSVLNWMF